MCTYRENNEKEKTCKLHIYVSFWLLFVIDNPELIVYYVLHCRLQIYLHTSMMLLESAKIFGCGH